MTEQKFERLVHEKLGETRLSLKEVRQVCEAYENALKETLENGNPIQIRGVFKTIFTHTKPKVLRNARTGKAILDEQGNEQLTPVRKVVKFRVSKLLKLKD